MSDNAGTAADGTSAFPGIAGSTVVVTGAGGDIGAGYVRACTAAGANVVAVDLPGMAEAGRTAAEKAAGAGPGRAVFVPADVTSDDDWATVVERSVSTFGRLDVLVNNAAVYRGLAAKRPLTELGVAEW